MRIKSLSIRGFKTFYEKSIIEFDSRISAIIGPNGCGKTNILDAMLWVLGEQNPRVLRSDSMSQLISDGNDNLPKHSFAEVSLLFENDNDNFVETEIKRKLYRTGESEYYLNNQQCRLKDITEIVMSFGAGSKGFTMIPQGQIDSYITAKPEEKKELIDEAAGLTKYKIRRAETERKILLIKDNLEKTKYVQLEVEQQKDLLQEQAGKAEEYTHLINQFKSLETLFYKKRFMDLDSKLVAAKNKKDSFQEALNEIERERKEVKKHIDNILVDQVTLKDNLDNLNNDLLCNKEEELEFISQNKTLKAEKQLFVDELHRSKLIKNEFKDELSTSLVDFGNLEKKYGSNNSKIEELKSQLKEIDKNRLNLEQIKKNCLASKEKEKNKLKEIQDNLQLVNRNYLDLNAEIKVTESRVKLLESIESTYGWLPEGIRGFVQNLKGKDINGILSDYIKPKSGYKKAVESALGEKLKWVLINDNVNPITTINEFKKTCTGKGTFISTDYPRIAGASADLDYKQIMECVECTKDDRPFLASIFGDTYVVDEIVDALKARESNPDSNFVTKDGEFFDSNGSITVGATPDSILQIKEEIKNLSNQQINYEEEIDLISLDITRREEEIFDINERISSFDNEIASNNEARSIMSGKLAELKSKLDVESKFNNQIKSEIFDTESNVQTEKIKRVQEKIGTVSKKIIEFEDMIELNTSKIATLQSDLPLLKQSQDEIKDHIDGLKTKINENELEVQALNNDVLSKDEIIDSKRVESLGFDSNIQKIQLEIDQLLENPSTNGDDFDISSISPEEKDKIAEFEKKGFLSKSRFYKLQKAIDDFGPVNLLALEEYKKLEDRYNFVNKQVNDLDTSLDNLTKTIKRIDQESETAFLEIFNQISDKYNESIKRLFGGGAGKLVLTNPDSIKDSGIEVMLKIGLKKYRDLKSYSGGERALAGIALLLSAYFVKPAPFLLLDEVDAPLDDKNISKFGKMLEEISHKSQIGIITHNKGTMKYGNKLIGVTSKLEGISEIVPFELPD